ncbi:MAG TPA: hypothetical protein DEV93_03305 [Chloroflexi bacterium]|nr:hypothetical protein [Chloroflexota bacterium]
MDSSNFTDRMATVQRSLEEIAGNISYALGELPSLGVQDGIRASIREFLAELASTLYDVRKEVWTLSDALHPPEDPKVLDAVEAGTDPRSTGSLIDTWLRRELERMHQLVISLQGDPALSLAYVLLTESAANILHAFSRLEAALDAITAGLEQAQERLEGALMIFRRLGARKDIERMEQELAALDRSADLAR